MKSSTIVIGATKSKKQNYIPNRKKKKKIVISIVISKLCTKHKFFYNLEFKSGLNFQLNTEKSYETKTENENTYHTGPR